MNKGWVWVDTRPKVIEARDDIAHSPIICVDTEYDSFRYFRAVLCLLQIKADKKTYLFDPFNRQDFSFLQSVFADPNILKIMHAGDNDIRLLKRDYGYEFHNIFDTHRAASILGAHYLSLSALVNQYLGIEFDKKKSMQRSRWETRPLSDEQLKYAVEDTAYLKDLYLRLESEIRLKGLTGKAVKTFDSIANVMWNEKTFNPLGYKNIKGYQSLASNQKRRLQRLYRLRFQKADETNMALFRICSDQRLIDLAGMDTLPDDVQEYLQSKKQTS